MPAAPFESILFDRPTDSTAPEPALFTDLNLDQVLESVTVEREEYDLAPFFSVPLRDVGAVRYRQSILRDLEQPALAEAAEAFAEGMRWTRRYLALAEKVRYGYEKEAWLLHAAEIYCEAVGSLTDELAALELESSGLRGLREYLRGYAGSESFAALAGEMRRAREALAGVRYTVRIKADRVEVGRYEDEPDYSTEVEGTFARFRQGAVRDYRLRLLESSGLDHVEARILELVALLYPSVFALLDEFWARHRNYVDPTLARFDREVQFYLAYLEYVAPLKAAGLPFYYPRMSARSKEEYVRETFDLALAAKLVREGSPVVCNDFVLAGPERVVVVTGPNQGGKTTFARMIGQLHYLAGLGLPVPAREARLFLPDRVFTHFEKEEDVATLRGKLEDDLLRIHRILEQATGESVIVMNESFTSTTFADALFLGAEILERIIEMDSLCVYVTFVDELASLGESTVSMVAMVDPDDPAKRTYEVVRRPADGLAYAAALAEKYGLTYERLRKRVAA
jgi:hypothetical protein